MIQREAPKNKQELWWLVWRNAVHKSLGSKRFPRRQGFMDGVAQAAFNQSRDEQISKLEHKIQLLELQTQVADLKHGNIQTEVKELRKELVKENGNAPASQDVEFHEVEPQPIQRGAQSVVREDLVKHDGSQPSPLSDIERFMLDKMFLEDQGFKFTSPARQKEEVVEEVKREIDQVRENVKALYREKLAELGPKALISLLSNLLGIPEKDFPDFMKNLSQELGLVSRNTTNSTDKAEEPEVTPKNAVTKDTPK